MPTNRTPRRRAAPGPYITAEAVEIFRRMRAVRNGSDAWWALHAELHDALGLRPWQWPAIEHPKSKCVYPPSTGGAAWYPHAVALWQELEAKAKHSTRL
jgi:hypothetical protein